LRSCRALGHALSVDRASSQRRRAGAGECSGWLLMQRDNVETQMDVDERASEDVGILRRRDARVILMSDIDACARACAAAPICTTFPPPRRTYYPTHLPNCP